MAHETSGSNLDHPKPCADRLGNLLILMLEQRKGIHDIIPLPLGFASP